jgi:hypothetical protein
MPVQWLYVLKDGTMVYPASASGSNATITGASAANPIVARVAYWTDDETSKVNINTAAGGEYWGPLVQKNLRQLTNSYWIPARWEYQRYPGHPARTDLQAVFPDLTRQQIWSLIPRVSDNGATAVSAMTTQPSSVPVDSDRLLASVGEGRFSATNSGGNRTDFTNNWSDRIERNKFLITASSRAPEITLYGTPRVSIWPIPTNTSTNFRTTLDNLFAFCSTIQKTTNAANPVTPTNRPYYFVHSTASNVAGDVSNATNAAMFTYLDSLSGCSNIPGIGIMSLASKYTPAGRDQLVTQFYDYVRNVNKHDDQLRYPDGVTTAPGFDWSWMFSPQGQLVPAVKRVTATGKTNYGFGRLPTVNQVALHFITTADGADTNSANPKNRSLWADTNSSSYVPLATNQVCVMAIAYIEPAMVGAGFPYSNLGDDKLNLPFNVSGLDQLTLEGQPLGFPALAQLHIAGWPSGSPNVMLGRSGGILKYLSFFVRQEFCKLPEARGGFTNADTITINYNARRSGSITTISGRGKITDTVNGTNNVPTSKPFGSLGTNALGSTVDLRGSYPLVSDPVRITKGSTMSLGSANIGVQIVLSGNTNSVAIPVPGGSIPAPALPPSTNAWVFSPEGWDGTSSGRFPGPSPSSNYLNAVGWETNLFLPAYDSVYAVATAHGDYRISMVRSNSPNNWAPVPVNPSAPNFRHRLFSGAPSQWVPGANYPDKAFELLTASNGNVRPGVPYKADLDALGFSGPLTYGDFDNGVPSGPDGAFINSPDEATAWGLGWTETYDGSALDKTSIFTTPNRKIASPIAFGSLPSAAVQDRPWQNLLFRPAPGVNHPGKAGFRIDGTTLTGAPPDYAWLDFFWMPVVEPWAISETFSTAGKINMNYQIAPFSYIRRTTGVQAVLKSGGVTAISSSASGYTGGNYIKSDDKSLADSRSSGAPPKINDQSPFPVNMPETLKGFDDRLSNNAALFRTASEICELPIVPVASGATYTSMTNATGNWWADWQYTGDNTKEATYNDIYPRLTTKSNTYTVHYRVQMLKKLPSGDQSTWDESKDKVASELRGSTLIERFLDPNATYPDYATAFSTSASLETYYRFRVLQRSQFTP